MSEYVDITLRLRHKNLLALTVTKPEDYMPGKVHLVPGPNGVYSLVSPSYTFPERGEKRPWEDSFLPAYVWPPEEDRFSRSRQTYTLELDWKEIAEATGLPLKKPWWRFW